MMKKLLILLCVSLIFSCGEKEEECISGDCKNGYGTSIFSGKEKGDKYIGDWKDNRKHGKGTYIYANGDKYVGEFREDKKHGKGMYTSAEGTIQEVLFKNGEFISE